MFPSVLIVDDEPSILQSLGGLLSDEGFEILTASNGYEALKIIDKESPDLVLLDIWMPGIDGIETLKEIKKDNPYIQVIIITGHGNIETAVKATKLGAFDLIEKPLSIDKVIVSINNALDFRRLEEENRYLRKKTIEKNSISGKSKPTEFLRKQIETAAPAETYILITGENGTGKELVARTIHHLSPRANQPLIAVNCAAIPEELIESELFGHEKGAFSGATTKKVGRFEMANNGTIFLDEIGDMSLKTQSKILRVLQEQKFHRVGGSRTLTVNVRVIAASNKGLEEEIEKGSFREDLYHRLNVIPIKVPALRQRREDIPLLVDIFLAESARQNQTTLKKLNSRALELLCSYPWPGNVRELKNLLERLTIMVKKDIIDESDLPDSYYPGGAKRTELVEPQFLLMDDFKEAKKAFEKEFILKKLHSNNNNITKTAKTIGVGRSYLHKKIKKLK
ncbi:MAG: sigma-54 dependent transcriptional regulator [Deltaproteobacteria bacterium]|nr:sigma-54 dependent transcriptional regulator [Deltaproteobacteria bacterium]MBT8374594.1 sigma-54 dependent transcriptional regulator [Deltaproteobacteria bacterium]NNK84461.1 sigma-54-dependent Fis family transcriptional regulator [Desulfobacterales bacterium]NNL41238.1 sigma-54-dependent Fis family transcriptional regulator [Desulfobacterales bacterium]